MNLDAVLFDAKPSAKSAVKTYDPFEAAVRTVIAEEADPVAREWVAGVIANRAKKSGKNFYDVVTEKGQFEPWKRGTAQAVDIASDDYKQTAERVRDILDGKRDPSEGATHFYAPEAQAELAKKDGRSPKAEFDDGSGVRVGATLFFRNPKTGAPVGGSVDDVLFGAAAPEKVEFTQQTPTISATDGKVTFGDTGLPVSPFQGETIATMAKAKAFDENAPEGSPKRPWVQRNKEDKFGPGEYYIPVEKVDGGAAIQRMPGGKKVEGDLGKGFGRGLGDILLSGAQMFPGSEDSDFRNRFAADQLLYDADLKGDIKSGVGRFLGQTVGGLAVMAPLEAVAIPAMAARGGIAAYAAGQGGRTMAPGIAKLVAQGGSQATRGALEGAAASALTHSAGEGSLGEQVATGALLGGAVRPVAGAVGSGVRRLIGGRPIQGAVPLDDQQALQAMAQGLPVPVRLDKGQITGAPGVQSEISAIRTAFQSSSVWFSTTAQPCK